MMDPATIFGELRRVKGFRERTAAAARSRALALMEQDAKELQRLREELVRFREERLVREQAVFEELRGRAVRLGDLEAMNRRIADWREEEAGFEPRIMAAEKALAEAKEALEVARRRHVDAMREVDKLDTLIDMQQQAAHREREAREENEVEEIVTAAYRRN